MTPGLRKFALTAHVTFSVGWLGAVISYLAVAIACLVSQDAQMVRSGYSTMELTGWFVIVPLSLAALLTGLARIPTGVLSANGHVASPAAIAATSRVSLLSFPAIYKLYPHPVR